MFVTRPASGVRLLLACVALLIGGGGSAWAQAYTSANAGAWSTTTTWSPNGTPGAGDTVSIGHDITLSANQAIDGITFTGTNSISGAFTLTLGGTATITVNAGGTGSITTTVIAGTAGVAKAGTGTLALSALNTYSGTTSVSAGTLRISGASGSISGSLSVLVEAGAVLDFDATSTSADRLADGGTLTMKGGTFSWETSGAASETIASMSFTKGHSFVSFSASGGSPTLTASGGVVRSNWATMEFNRGPSPFGFLIWTGTTTGLTRWTVVEQAGGAVQTGNYDATNGLVQLGTGTQFTEAANQNWASTAPYAFSPSAVPGAGDHVAFTQQFKVHDAGSQAVTSVFGNALDYAGSTGTDGGGSLTINGNVYQRNTCRMRLGGLSLSFGANEAVYITTGTGNGEFSHYADLHALTCASLTISGTSAVEINSNLDGNAAVFGGGTSTAMTKDINVAGGTLRAGADAALGTAAGVTTVYDGASLIIGNSGHDTYRPAAVGVAYTTAEPLTISGTGVAGGIGAFANGYGDGSFAGPITLAANASIGAASGTTFTLSGAIGGGFALTKAGTGVLLLTATNTWTGATTIGDGTLRVSGGAAIPDASGVTIANLATAGFDLNGSGETIASLAGGGAAGGNVTLGAGTLTIGGSATTTYDGVISGGGGLTVSGSGALTLSRASSYTGTTTIGSGTLYVNANNSTSAVSLASTGMLGGTGRVGAIGSTAGCNGGIVEPGTAAAKGTLIAGSTNLSLGTNATIKVRVGGFATAGTDYDRLDLATAGGSLTLGGASKIIVDLTGVSGAGTASGVVTCSSRSGTFATVSIINPPSGYNATVVYNSGSVDVMVDSAATTTWLGTTSAAWGTSANWGNGVPDGAHLAQYVAAFSNPCTVAANSVALGMSIQSGYASAITQGAGSPLYCGTSGFVMAAAGATYTCNDTLYAPTFNQTAGTFNGSGTLYLVGASGGTLHATSALNNLEIEGLDSGLIGYWKLDETSGSSAFDLSGNGNHGTVTGAAPDAGIAPIVVGDQRSLLYHSGQDDRVDLPDSALWDWDESTQSRTLSLWAKFNSLPATTEYPLLRLNGSNGAFYLTIDGSGNKKLTVSNGFGTWFQGNAMTVNTGTWYHFAWVATGGSLSFYQNGVPVGTSTFSPASALTPTSASIGGYSGAPSWEKLDGYLDDVRYFNRALSEAEIWSLDTGLGGSASQSSTFTLTSPITVNGDFKLDSGTLADGGNTLTINGSCTCYGPVTGSGTVALTGTGAGKTLRCGESRFPNLTVNSSDTTGVWTLQDRLAVAGTLTIAAGQLDVSASNYAIHCGTLNQTGGSSTLAPRSGTIVADSASGGSIKASTALNALRVEDATETNLLAYWKFDSQSGLTARDWSGNGNTATFMGGAMHSTATPAATLFDNAGSITCDGADDWVDLGAGAGMTFAASAAFTVSAWVNTTENEGPIIAFRSSTSATPVVDLCVGFYGSSAGNGLLCAYVRDDAGNNTSGSLIGPAVNDGAWHHVALTRRTNGRIILWCDGVWQATGTGVTGSITTDLRSAGSERRWVQDAFGTADERYLNGKIDDVRVYGTELLEADMRDLDGGRYFNGASGTATYTLAANLSTGSLGIDAGLFNANGFATTVTNLFTLRDGNGTYTGGSGTQTFNGGLTVDGSTFTGGTGTVAVVGDFTQAGATDIAGYAPQSGGTFTAPSTTMTITGSVTHGGTFLPNGGTVQLNGAAAGKTLAGVPTTTNGLIGSYFNTNLRATTQDDWRSTQVANLKLIRVDGASGGLAFDTTDSWGTALEYSLSGASNASTNWDTFSVQWDGWITVPVEATSIAISSDDSSRAWIDLNGDGVVENGEWGSNNWGTGQAEAVRVTHIGVGKGRYRIRIQYEEGTGSNRCTLAWSDSAHSAGAYNGYYVVPSAYLAPLASGGGLTFNNLQITGAGSWTINDALTASGTITCSAGTLTQGSGAAVSAGAWSQAGGTFTGSSGTGIADGITVAGAFGCSTGTFTSTKASLNVGGNFTVSGGTFAHNAGTLEMRATSAGVTLTCAQALGNLRVNDGLIAYWNFDEASSPAIDLTGRGHDAAWVNSPTPSTTTLPTIDATNARAMPLDGTSQYLAPARQYDFQLSPVSITAWAYMPSSAGTPSGLPIFNRQAVGNSMLSLECVAGGYKIVINGVAVSSNAVAADTWHQVTGTYDGATARIFIDGVLHTTGSITGPVGDFRYATVALGRNEWNQAGFFPGSFDEVRVYNRVLSAATAARLASQHDPGASLHAVTLGSSLTLAGDVTLLAGTLDTASLYDLSVGGSWTNRGGVFKPTTRTVTLTGSGTVRAGNQPFNNLVVNASGTYTAVDQIRTTGTFTESAGTFVAPPTRLICLGDCVVSGGTFTPNGGTLIMKSQTGSTLTCAQALNNLVFTDGLVAQWEFEEASGPSLDISGWGHQAAWTFAPTPDAANKPGLQTANTRSLSISTASGYNYLTVPDGFEFLPSSKHSVATWVYLTASSEIDEGQIFGRMGDNAGPGNPGNQARCYNLQTMAGVPGLMYRVHTGTDPNANTNYQAMPLNGWHHVAVVADATTLNFYLDGAVVAASNLGAGWSLSDASNADDLIWIGRNSYYRGFGGFHPAFNGEIDDLRFYDRDLSAAEVARIASGREPQTSAATFALGSDLTINGNLTIGSGTLDIAAHNLALAGNYRCEGKITSSSGTPGTLTFSGTGVASSILCGNQPIPNVAVGGTGTWTCSDRFATAGAFTQTGATFAANGKPMTVAGALAVNGGTLQGPASEIIACGGDVTDNGGVGQYQAGTGALEMTSTTSRSLGLASSCNHLWIASGANAGMVARFRLDEAQYGAAYDDVSGIAATPSNTPTASTSVPTMWTNDPYCLDCSGATSGSDNDYLTVANSTTMDNLQNSSYSISAWFYPRALPPGTGSANDAYYAIVAKAGFTSGLVYDDTGVFFMGHWLTGGVFAQASSSNAYPPNAWYHLCGVVDTAAGTTKIYVNGALAGAATWTGGTATFAYGSTPWTIGIAIPGAATWMWPANGLIDDVRFYGRALSAQEALVLANNGLDAANGAATFTLSRAAQCSGDLDLLGGTLSAAGNAITADAAWRNLVGTSAFAAGGDTVTLGGTDQQLYGSTIFANLAKAASSSTLTFPVYECQTITGTMTLTGVDASHRLLIRSSIPHSMATINPTGGRSCSFVDVQDSRNFSMPIINPDPGTANSLDSGDDRWWFGAAKGNGVLIAMPPVE